MTDLEFICGLMRHNTDALGFIPRPALLERWIKQGNYIIQRDRFAKPIGYLLHGPVNDERTLYINQACIELDKRNRGFGKTALNTLLNRAIEAHATTILLRCATDLDAVEFWMSCGFNPIAITPGGARRHRTIIQFEHRLPQDKQESDSALRPEALRPNA